MPYASSCRVRWRGSFDGSTRIADLTARVGVDKVALMPIGCSRIPAFTAPRVVAAAISPARCFFDAPEPGTAAPGVILVPAYAATFAIKRDA